jgi:mxaJ protein
MTGANALLRRLLLAMCIVPTACGVAARPRVSERVLRVCSDPNNMPFSNAEGEGFENALAELVAEELDARVAYTWWAQRRGFIRSTLGEHRCDLVMGVPASMELTLTTRPYYRSTYVFATRRDGALRVTSLDDSVLRRARVGVQLIGDDYSNAPPAHALARRGIVHNVVGYTVYGDYSQQAPASRIVEAVAAGEIDIAIVWGAMAGYFAQRARVPLDLVPVEPQIDLPFLPMVFDIALGVRREDVALRDEIDAVLERRRDDIERLLTSFHVPRVGGARRVALDRGGASPDGRFPWSP